MDLTPEQNIDLEELVEKCHKGWPSAPLELVRQVCEYYITTPNAFNKVCDAHRADPEILKQKYCNKDGNNRGTEQMDLEEIHEDGKEEVRPESKERNTK